MKRVLARRTWAPPLLALSVVACHSDESAPEPLPAESVQGTKIVIAPPPSTSPAQQCRIRIGGDAFAAARDRLGARAVAAIHVDGDYTRTLAKVSVEPSGDDSGPIDSQQDGAGVLSARRPIDGHGESAGVLSARRPTIGPWSGTFNGPRDAFVEMLQRRICTDEGRVHVLSPRGAKDPSKGEIVLDVFVLTPDEHRDVDDVCHAYERAPKPPAPATRDAADAAAMMWLEDVLTTPKWMDWRHDFARERADLFARKTDAASLFHTRGAALAATAKSEKLACPTALEWTKR